MENFKISKGLFNQYASDYAKENNGKRLDYAGLARLVGNRILCNNIPSVDPSIWDNVHCGSLDYIDDYGAENDYQDYLADYENSLDDEEPMTYEEWFEENKEDYIRQEEIYQYFLVHDTFWLEKANELVLYSELLDCYVWCITHWGTGWDYVLTSLECEDENGAE